jgi:hypothetical protein
LVFVIWNLSFGLAQDGEPVEPPFDFAKDGEPAQPFVFWDLGFGVYLEFVICDLVFLTSSIAYQLISFINL